MVTILPLYSLEYRNDNIMVISPSSYHVYIYKVTWVNNHILCQQYVHDFNTSCTTVSGYIKGAATSVSSIDRRL